jgi:hypothetical protein
MRKKREEEDLEEEDDNRIQAEIECPDLNHLKSSIEEKQRYKISKYGTGIFLYFDMQEKLLAAFAYIGLIGMVMMLIYSYMGGLSYMGDN